jgi:hypothetical protein
MKKIFRKMKKGLVLILCFLAVMTAVPMLNYLDTHDHHHHDHVHDNGTESKGFFQSLFEDYSIYAKAASCPHKRLSPNFCTAEHPHYNFVDCWDCGARIYTGGTTYKSNCSTCNPALNCRHTGSKWTDSIHPHPTYCQVCSTLLGYGYYSSCIQCNPCAYGHSYGSTSYSSSHPHHGYRYCTRCGTSSYIGTTTMSSCITCNPCANGHDYYAYFCDAEHPHENYHYCSRCRYKQYDGTYRYKSNCKQCNPDLVCQHTGDYWVDTEHPHPIYCRDCSAVLQAQSTASDCALCTKQDSGSSSIEISAWTDLTSVTGSGILSIEYSKEIDDHFYYSATVTGNDSLKSITCTGGGGTSSSGSVRLKGDRSITTYTITATTNKGATRTISVTIKTQTAAVGDIRYQTVGMNIREIKGNGFRKSASGRIALEGASNIPQSENDRIAAMVGRFDGGTYTLNGSLVIKVSNSKTGKDYGEFDVLSDYDELIGAFGWGQNTLADFETMQSADVTYQAPKEINAIATYCSQDKSTVFGSVTAQSIGAPQYVFPYETQSVTFHNGLVSISADWEYHGAQWTYNPQGNGYYNGSAVGQTNITQIFTSETPKCEFFFYWKANTGSITVSAVDSETGSAISGAAVSLGGPGSPSGSGQNGSTFSGLAFGTYTASASAAGYISNSRSVTITTANPNQSVTVPLTKIPPPPPVDLDVVIQTNGTYRKGSTVIVSATCFSDRDILPSSPAAVTLLATYQKKVGSGQSTETITSQTKNVIIPSGESNLVWFELTLPETGYFSDAISLSCTITPPDNMSGIEKTNHKTIDISEHIKRSAPNPRFEDRAPHSYSVPLRPDCTSRSITWNVWEWIGNSFQNKTYSVSLAAHASLEPDSTAGYRSYSSVTGLWTTRSGYGLTTQLTVSIDNVDDAVVGSAKADAYYPEFKYSVDADRSSNLLLDSMDLSSGKLKHTFVFAPNLSTISGNRMHMTPIWFPDGKYTVHYQIYDIWTPGGELTASENATIYIDGNMYDDSYVSPK